MKLVRTPPPADPAGGGDAPAPEEPPAGAEPPAVAVRPSAGVARAAVRRRRATPRRTVVRRVPAPDPVAEVLARLDEEPVGLLDTAPTPPIAESAGDDGSDPSPPDQATTTTPTSEPTTAAAATTAETATRRRPLVTAALAVALCAALAAAGFFGYRWYQDRTLTRAHAAALAAARQTTVNFVSVSASSVDSDLQRIVAGATGEFREEFLRGQPQVRAAVIENKVESTGTVLRAGLISGDRRTAVVLVAVDATVKNVHAPEGRVAHYRIQVDLTHDRDSDTWLVSRLQFVG
ncbi:hypothetical protein EF879_19665 [Micromonospora sp. HM5-17]|nr:hypothetical protein EF879_19665 [Micromonospora sp. HM5-17]